MAQTDFQNIDEYLETLPEDAQVVLQQVRQALLEGVPDGIEGISYQIPIVKRDGPVFFFAAWQKHYSIYPVTPSLLEQFGAELKAFDVAKGTIRFSYAMPVPVRLITSMAKFRAQENAQVAANKAAAKAAGRAARQAAKTKR